MSGANGRRVHIAFNFVEGPYGGGNQFLKALRSEIVARGLYVDDINEAKVVIINSFHRGQEAVVRTVIKAKRENPELLVFHRVDGPYSLVRGRKDSADKGVRDLNRLVADGTIFQSNWSRSQCLQHRLISPQNFQAVITNAPDSNMFLPVARPPMAGRKVRLVASSWSMNPNKGFEAYEWMDRNLDWNKFEMTFFGNSPRKFFNIRARPAVRSIELARELPTFDIFVSAARNEPCSNALIEALHSGLPAVFYGGGGSPEIVGRAGVSFLQPEEISSSLNQILQSYDYYVKQIAVPSIEQVANQYLALIDDAYLSCTPKKIDLLRYWRLEACYLSAPARAFWALRGKLAALIVRIRHVTSQIR